ncbi:MAG TPA: hypothetical protein VMW65_18050, partial [Chloroflexota bacterium]|nr:hypothetical protein [Chloroflexota bacterium]
MRGLPAVAPGNVAIDVDAKRFVPVDLADDLRIVPIGRSGDGLRLAVPDWSEIQARRVWSRLRLPVDAQ